MNFTDALNRKLEEVERPPNLPVGHYIWQISKVPDIEDFESSKTGTAFKRITFNLSCVEATDEVDPDELEEYGNPAGALNRKSFLFSLAEEDKAGFDRSMFQLRRFLENAGADTTVSLEEGMNAIVGNQIMGEIAHRPDPNDPEVIYAEVRKTAAV